MHHTPELPAARYRAEVRWTSYGIPHFEADDMPSIAYASAYFSGKDIVCELEDEIVRVRSERAKYFGPGEEDINLNSDVSMLALQVRATAERTYPQLDDESRDLIVAYSEGFNRYLSETPPAALPTQCRGADWVSPLQPADLWAYYYWLSMGPFIDFVFDNLPTAVPPPTPHASNHSPALRGGASHRARAAPDFAMLASRIRQTGSNAWAIGAEHSESGGGMLLANPHLPWRGRRRMYEQQITVPGVANVYGASWLGMPTIAIGFNEHVAWTHTTSPAAHGTLYRLQLVPGNPTEYMFEGEVREMSAHSHDIQVKQPDGSVSTVSRTLYRSHYGPMLYIPVGGEWTAERAYTFRDANDGNTGFIRTYLDMNRAKTLQDLERAQQTSRGLSWANLIAASEEGTALFYVAGRTPAITDGAEQAYRDAITADNVTLLLRNMGLVQFDGTTSLSDWEDRDPVIPGLTAPDESPRLERRDFVANSNDSHWLTNPQAPLTGFSALFGQESALLSARTRMNLKLLGETGPSSSAGADDKFSLDELAAVPFNNRAAISELLRDELVARCKLSPIVKVTNKSFDLTSACSVLEAWDLRVDKDSAGAPLWREFLGNFHNMYRGVLQVFGDTFDPNDPIGTPRQLVAATGQTDPALRALGNAAQRLQNNGFSEAVTLRELQFTLRGAERIPLQGGTDSEGAFNVVDYVANDGSSLPKPPRGALIGPLGLTTEGYQINAGSSFMLVTAFTPQGVRARALLSYSQASDPDSPHFADQTRLFSEQTWRDVRFVDADIEADPELRREQIEVE